MEKIYLNNLLHFNQDDYGNIKIKFNQSNGYEDPMELYQSNPDIVNNQWLFWRSKQRYFYVGQISICFLKLSYDTWLLTTIKKVTKELNIYDGINYEGEELEEYKSYFGRVVIKYRKTFQQQGRYYGEICDDLEVQQILPTIFDGDDFPGYDKVRLSYKQLESVLNRGKRDWIAALENQKAVYLITDKENGKMYVGSATSDYGMLLQRWRSYVVNGHGGNKELVELVSEKGYEYIKANFQYSILENYNAKVDDRIILERESWWKETLQTRRYGYNSN
ncbi:GIY-YIG nuclease family protein [Tissierella praeacuta]|uniref:GIY-YIG nuclease family protein n=1 Tax=Tissierella praeacuta TaxID=43131 RepID=UPI00333E3616